MIPLTFAKGQRYAVLGLARSGLAAAEALAEAGAEVACWDDSPAQREKAKERHLRLVEPGSDHWREATALVLSPGIPHSHPRPHPATSAARAAGVPIIGDIELLARAERDAQFVGITGTNGKSTTTALVAHILEACGRHVQVGGNLGTPVLSLQPLGRDGIYVLEMSSYQLELVETLAFDVALLLNITPDHLERHGGFAGYVAAKTRIFRNKKAPQTAVIGIDDATCRALAEELAAVGDRRVWPISAEGTAAGGVYVTGASLIDDTEGWAEPCLDLTTLSRLPGRHNWQNVAAAFAACRGLGLAPQEILAALPSFPGLAHRQELVAEICGVRFVNDSKATNADAAAKALSCYDAIWWIAGGRPKDTGLQGLEPFYPNIVQAFLIGEAETAFERELHGKVKARRCGDLATATRAAFAAARGNGRPGAVVLLSPACASFDQFSDFEARGEAFRSVVRALQAEAAA